MRSRGSKGSRALAWICIGLVLFPGPGQVVTAAAAINGAAPLSPSGAERSTARVARLAAQPVRIDTSRYAGQPGRLVMRLRAEGTVPGVHVRWTARGPMASGVAQPGERVVLLEQASFVSAVDDVLSFEVFATSGVPEATIVLLPEFTFEPSEGYAEPASLRATGADGAPVRIALAPWQLWAETTPTSLWQVASPLSEPMPAGVQPTGNGVRLQHDFANKRFAIAPEATDQHGFAVKGAVAAALSKRAAFGVVGGGGSGQQDLVVNAGIQVRPAQRLLVSFGNLRQEVDLPFETGRERRRLRQASGGAAYRVALGGPLQPSIDMQAYMADSGSLELGAVQYFSDRDGQAQIFRLDRRVAGARLTGAQTRTALRLGADATLTLTLGAERLRYAFATGNNVTHTATRGVDWIQQLSRGYSLQAYARTQAAMHVTGVRTERRFGSQGHRVGIELTRINGRNGLMDDTQLRFTQTFSFGGPGSASPQTRDDAGRERNAEISALLDDVSQRPVFLPLVPLAKVDPTLQPERLVAIDHAGMVPGTTISTADGTVRVPAGAVEIKTVAKNGAVFTNTGQFSVSGTDLLIHPMRMEAPASGIDQYIVVMRNVEGRSTTATVDVARGSVHILRVTLSKEEADTTPDAFAFASAADVAVSAMARSEEVVIRGLNEPAPITITGGEYSIEGGPFTSEPGKITNGQRVVVRLKAPATYGSSATSILTIGGVSLNSRFPRRCRLRRQIRLHSLPGRVRRLARLSNPRLSLSAASMSRLRSLSSVETTASTADRTQARPARSAWRRRSSASSRRDDSVDDHFGHADDRRRVGDLLHHDGGCDAGGRHHTRLFRLLEPDWCRTEHRGQLRSGDRDRDQMDPPPSPSSAVNTASKGDRSPAAPERFRTGRGSWYG